METQVGDIIKSEGYWYLIVAALPKHWLAIRDGSLYPAATVVLPREPD